MKKKKDIYKRIVMLTRSKINSIESLKYKALIDFEITNDEY